MRRARRRVLATLVVALTLTGCGSSSATTSSSAGAPASHRPSSTATVRIVAPAPGAALTGTTVHVRIAVDGARVIQETNQDIRPDQGHVHLYLDGALIYMNYTLEQDVPVHPGTFQLYAEFVANDHAPFDPRDRSPTVVFTVR